MNKNKTNIDGVSIADINKGKREFINTLIAGARKQTIREWTREQLAIFAWFITGISHLVIRALPGTGKTSTCIESLIRWCRMFPNQKAIYLAFMSRNAQDAKTKLPAELQNGQVHVATCNAIGNQILNRTRFFVHIDPKFTPFTEHNRAAKLYPELKTKRNMQRLIFQIVSAAKNAHIGIPSVEWLVTLANTRAIAPSDKEQAAGWSIDRLCGIARQVMEVSLEDRWRSFDDQIWQPLTLDLVRGEFDLVILDEMQDFNLLNYEFGKRLVKSQGRIVGVGDNNQSMYTFRGAVPNGMERFAEEIQAGSLSLSETFRVPKTGVAALQGKLPNYVAHSSNREGELIQDMTAETMTSEATIGCAILSRTNAPLMGHCLAFIRKGKAARIEGKDIGRNLLDVLEQVGADDINAFENSLGIWEQTRIAKAGNGWSSSRTVELVTDQAATLRILCESCDSVTSMKQKIKDLFQDTKDNPLPAIVLSTIHKAKGLEWETVYVLSDTFSTSRQPSNETEQAEEEHIKIVAATRHWNKLAYVSGKPTAKPAKLPVPI